MNKGHFTFVYFCLDQVATLSTNWNGKGHFGTIQQLYPPQRPPHSQQLGGITMNIILMFSKLDTLDNFKNGNHDTFGQIFVWGGSGGPKPL